ncbi:unnamed protein product [[Candida] boidinii]|uniref:Unnamed protein product n=1 Tax=Candida boidinii TaxID=5477 RepID=A0A9W6WIK3_CANBO|nr:unnamed protein product [[Candida] boidinii]GMF53525.1 unnamed protein product [[Candida] boidinii]GMG10077.1 unnamed protein product [[Candida] boidinii]
MPDIKLQMQTSDSKHKRKTREKQGKNKGRTVGSMRLQRLAATADGKRTSAGGPAQTLPAQTLPAQTLPAQNLPAQTPAQTATSSRQQTESTASDGIRG